MARLYEAARSVAKMCPNATDCGSPRLQKAFMRLDSTAGLKTASLRTKTTIKKNKNNTSNRAKLHTVCDT
jgi:hypothetical protein